MAYLIWTIVNLSLFLFFIYTCLRATKHIRKDMGLLAAIIFVFGSFSFICQKNGHSSTRYPSNTDASVQTFASDSVLSHGFKTKEVTLEKSITCSIRLAVIYGNQKPNGGVIPAQAYTNLEGLQGGLSWKYNTLTITPTADLHKFNYQVVGNMEWSLLGYTFYNQGKSYSGILTL